MTEQKLNVGDYAKINRHGERFWVIVEGSSEPGHYVGKVNNHLMVAPYKLGDSIPFGEAEVIDHLEPEKK
jgi:hypothetical protein